MDTEALRDEVRNIERAAEALNNLIDSDESETPDFSSILSDLEEARSQLSRAEDSIPNRYTEVGEVADMGDSLEGYIGDADYALRAAIDALESLSNN
jgi:K+/H+ antiporter YhaU regulatory subunit KhtT